MAPDHELHRRRAALREIRQRVPLWRRRLFWGMARYECREGPPDDEDGPFADEPSLGCGWEVSATVGVGVGRDVDGRCGVHVPKRIEGGCEMCGGHLELIGFGPVGSGRVEAPAPQHLPALRVPSKRVSRRLAHSGEFVAEFVKPGRSDPA